MKPKTLRPGIDPRLPSPLPGLASARLHIRTFRTLFRDALGDVTGLGAAATGHFTGRRYAATCTPRRAVLLPGPTHPATTYTRCRRQGQPLVRPSAESSPRRGHDPRAGDTRAIPPPPNRRRTAKRDARETAAISRRADKENRGRDAKNDNLPLDGGRRID